MSFELIIVADNYGLFAYSCALFAVSVWWLYFLGEETSACTYYPLEDWVDGEMSFRECMIRVGAQLVGGILSFPIVFMLWYLEAAETHVGRAIASSGKCKADLQVSVLAGALIEGGFTLIYRLACRYFYDKITRSLALVLDSLVGVVLVAVAFSLSGGYFNPVQATALMWGCSLGIAEHLFVYWFASSIGALMAVKIYRLYKPAKLDFFRRDQFDV